MEYKHWYITLPTAAFVGIVGILRGLYAIFPGLFTKFTTSKDTYKDAKDLDHATSAKMNQSKIDGTVERIIFLQDNFHHIFVEDIYDTLLPDIPIDDPIRIQVEDGSWPKKITDQTIIVHTALLRYPKNPKIAVYSFDDIPMAIHLGYLLKEISDIKLFQYDLKKNTWRLENSNYNSCILIKGVPTNFDQKINKVIIRVSITAQISDKDAIIFTDDHSLIDLSITNPEEDWLKSEEQISLVMRYFADILAAINKYYPLCEEIHLLFAGPSTIAIRIGQLIGHINTKVVIYKYRKMSLPKYSKATILNE